MRGRRFRSSAVAQYMNKILSIIFLLLCTCLIGYAQKTEMRPVPGSKPFIVPNGGFENLDVPASMDRLGKVSEKDMKAHLDTFVGLISSGNKTVEYVILLNGKVPSNVGAHMEFIYNYLTIKKKVAPSRISFAVATESANETELWLVPNENIWIPSCMDCSMIPAENKEKLGEYFKIK